MRANPASSIPGVCLLLVFAALVAAGLGRIKAPPTPAATVSIGERPTWPYAWSQQAQALAAHGDVASPRFDEIRATASELGASERNLRQSLAIQSLQNWSELSKRGRYDAEADLRFALQTQPQAVLNAAFTMHLEDVPCGLWDQGGAVGEVCERMRGLRRICDQPRINAEQQRWCFAHGALSPSR